LEQAVVDNPDYADAHALLGQALDQLDRPQQALDHLEAALALTPDSALCRSLLGLHYLQVGDPAAARPHLEAAYDLDPDNPVFSLHLASMYAGLGQYTVAEVWLREATRLAPEDALVWEAVARFYLERGLVEGQAGLEAAQALAELEPQDGLVLDLLGWAHFLKGNSTEAEEHLLEAIELDPALPSAHYHLGQVYAYLGRAEEARAVLTRALDLNTDPALRGQIEQLLLALP
jgi:Flp pilus assembly protein TadD